MSRRFTVSFVIFAAMFAGCSSPEIDISSSESTLQNLTPAQLAGQRIIYGYPGLVPPPELFDRIRAGEAAGVHFSSLNIESRDQIRAVVAELVGAQQESPIPLPLLLITDQEGGAVRALGGEPLVTAKQIGLSPNAEALAVRAGADAAEALRDVGMNVNLAPVLDVFREPGGLIDQLERSYSNDPNVVRRLGAAFVRGHRSDGGVAAGAKHFPGLGALRADQTPDFEPVTLDISRNTLRNVDERPYVGAIAAGVELVMTSWVVYTGLDDARPAGLSPLVLRQELRGRLGFRGVTISDVLIAGALDPFGGHGERAVLAAGAGEDLLLCAFSPFAECDNARDGLATALQNGELDKVDSAIATLRILALRAKLN